MINNMRYYIADCHFFHEKVRLMDKRPFESLEEMHEVMIQRWNERVGKKDEIVILGDFSMGRAEETMGILQRLQGKKYLIRGNHDNRYLHGSNKFDRQLFQSIEFYQEMHDNKRKVILCHYPVICYNGQYRGDVTYMLYGHVHETMDYQNVQKFIQQTRETKLPEEHSMETIPCNMINCFCGRSNYTPLTLDEWIALEPEGHQRAR